MKDWGEATRQYGGEERHTKLVQEKLTKRKIRRQNGKRGLTSETLTREEKPKLTTLTVYSVVCVTAPPSHQLSNCMFTWMRAAKCQKSLEFGGRDVSTTSVLLFPAPVKPTDLRIILISLKAVREYFCDAKRISVSFRLLLSVVPPFSSTSPTFSVCLYISEIRLYLGLLSPSSLQ